MASRPSSPAERCRGRDRDARADVALPVLKGDAAERGPRIRRSRSGPRRAAVLLAVQALMVVHVVVWLLSRRYGWFGGVTVTPVEPSEGMEFVKHGVLNAGAIFFAALLLSTVILGRWFCGWACHVVLLQDACAWFMKRLGVRPKPFRSRLLVYVPLLLGLYMFAWPPAYRLVVEPAWNALADAGHVDAPRRRSPPWAMQVEVTREDFWATFPGVMLAIPFLGICGFATVYFLGAKGYCTYGCPYGGLFAPLDRLAPWRIRVNDDCEQCGHCTAVCTSNVRVHEEVAAYGMVVDSGCMKCLDCVSVCPNEALSFGPAGPSLAKGAPRGGTAPRRKYDLSWREEIALALVFAASFAAVRGGVVSLPLLMASGTAGVTTFILWKAWRVWRDPNVSLHRFRLRYRGRVSRAGWVYTVLAAALAAFTLNCAAVNAAHGIADRADWQVTVPAALVFAGRTEDVPEAQRDAARRALRWYTVASSVADGGVGLTRAGQRGTDLRRAWFHAVLGAPARAEALVRGVEARHGRGEDTALALVQLLEAQGRAAEAERVAVETLEASLGHRTLLERYVGGAYARGALDEAIAVCRARLELDAEDAQTLYVLAALLVDAGDPEGSVALLRRAIAAAPDQPRLRAALADALARSGDAAGAEAARADALAAYEEALAAPHPEPGVLEAFVGWCARTGRPDDAVRVVLDRAERVPRDRAALRQAGVLLIQVGRPAEALPWLDRLVELEPRRADVHALRAVALARLGRLDDAIRAMRRARDLAPDDRRYESELARLVELARRDGTAP